MKMITKIAIALFLVASIVVAPFIGGVNRVSAQEVPAQWDVTYIMNPEQANRAQDVNASMADSLQSTGVAMTLAGDTLTLSGSQGIEQMRSALFDGAKGYADFLGGPVELTVTLPASDFPVTLRLESRVTTGYSWVVLDGNQADLAQSEAATFEMRYRGFGAPAIQTIQLQPAGPSGGTVRLVYRRQFEQDEPVHARLNLTVPEGSSLVEINDPTPKALDIPQADLSASSDTNIYDDLTTKALPTSWDWRKYGIVPAVRDQGSCGGCWAFGTVGVMESAVRKGGGPLTDLSEQFLIDCNEDTWSCADGGFTASMYHVNTLGANQSAIGPVLESVKPFTETDGSCSVALPHVYKGSSWKFIVADEFTMPTVTQIKTAIYTYGPVTAGVCAGSGWDNYTGGVFSTSETSQCGGGTNHQIILVGWNDANQTWILRNTWGTGWGDKGYMHIKWNVSRVGEGTSWVKYGTSALPFATTIAPSGNITKVRPTYTWSRVSGATSYKLRVKDVAAGTYKINGITVSSSYCSATTNRCNYTPATTYNLTFNRSYQWQVSVGSGVYSAVKSFKPVK